MPFTTKSEKNHVYKRDIYDYIDVSLNIDDKEKITDFSWLVLRLLVFCVLKLKNSQYKYVKANSQIISKENWTGGFWPPYSEQVICEYFTEYMYLSASEIRAKKVI